MSAFVVNQYHIHRMVATAMRGPSDKARVWNDQHHLFDHHETPDVLGLMLHRANVASVNYRYQDSEQPEAYTYDTRTLPMSTVEALKALSCYEYQSCERPDWQGSTAQEWCERLRHAIINAMPGYNDAPWEQAPQRAAVR